MSKLVVEKRHELALDLSLLHQARLEVCHQLRHDGHERLRLVVRGALVGPQGVHHGRVAGAVAVRVVVRLESAAPERHRQTRHGRGVAAQGAGVDRRGGAVQRLRHGPGGGANAVVGGVRVGGHEHEVGFHVLGGAWNRRHAVGETQLAVGHERLLLPYCLLLQRPVTLVHRPKLVTASSHAVRSNG